MTRMLSRAWVWSEPLLVLVFFTLGRREEKAGLEGESILHNVPLGKLTLVGAKLRSYKNKVG